MTRIVIALGGNAIQSGKDASASAQQKACRVTAKQLIQIIKEGYEIVVAHGNGPQVGNIALQQEIAHSNITPAMPFDTCGAMSQGMIGYWLQQTLKNELQSENIKKEVATIVTQSLVDQKDPSFLHPTKPIGPFYSEIEAEKLSREKGYTMKEDAGRGYRRVVPSPKPIDIVEGPLIRSLVDSGAVVIAGGGGGVPVIAEDNLLKGVEAVIDKDLAAEKIGEIVDADILLILTAVDYAKLYYHTTNEVNLKNVTVEELSGFIREGHFAPGSMLPKVEAGAQFASLKKGRKAIITSLDSAYLALKGETGTHIIS